MVPGLPTPGERGNPVPRLLLLLVLLPAVARAAVVEAFLPGVEGSGWRAEQVRLTIVPRDDGHLSLELAAERFRLAEPAFTLSALRLDCSALVVRKPGGGRCTDGRFSLAMAPWRNVEGRFSGHLEGAAFALVVDPLELDRARLRGRLEGDGEKIEGTLSWRRLALAPPAAQWLPGWSVDGETRGSLEGGLSAGGRWQGRLELEGDGLSFSDDAGLRVGEGLRFGLDGRLRGRDGVVAGRLTLRLNQGQLYLDPFYLALEKPLVLTAEGRAGPGGEVRLRSLTAEMEGLLSLSGGLRWKERLEGLDLRWRLPSLSRAYPALLQPLLIGTPLDELSVSGTAGGHLTVAGGEPREVRLRLEGVTLEDGRGRFGLKELAGTLHWSALRADVASRLSWREGHLYRVVLGGATLVLKSGPDEVEAAPFTLPLLGGRLHLEKLRVTGLRRGDPEATGGARLEALDLAQLSRALEWPPLEGRLDAVVPRLHYRDGRLVLEGELVVKLFGGRVVVEGLEIEDLLGPAPVLETRLRLENLDLARLTQALSFGRIEGTLEGRVRRLRLVGWEPAAFDAEFRSPDRDPRPHRISQRAIDDLTELGNGVAAGLSGTFLGLFDDFAYDRLELRVRLEGDTAWLDGARRPDGGYYIVKGARLPRVDVIGRNHRVAWKDLIARLKNIRLQGIVVE